MRIACVLAIDLGFVTRSGFCIHAVLDYYIVTEYINVVDLTLQVNARLVHPDVCKYFIISSTHSCSWDGKCMLNFPATRTTPEASSCQKSYTEKTSEHDKLSCSEDVCLDISKQRKKHNRY